MATLEREQLLQELINLADGKTISNESGALLDFLHERLQCPGKQHGELPKALDAVLDRIVVDGHNQALAGFQRNSGTLHQKTPDAAAAYVAAFGELRGLSDAKILDDLAVTRRARKRLADYREGGDVEAKRRRRFAGMWFPRNIVDERQVRRAYKDWKYKNGELILTNSMLDALISYLDKPENIRACQKQLDELMHHRNEITAEEKTATWLAPGYVRRSKIEQRFSELVEVEHARLIAFVGQAGMGKTVAAKALTDKYSSRPPAPLIRFIDGQISAIDLQVALQRQGVAVPHITSENAQENLVRLISAEEAPEFVILDNFEDIDQVAAMLPYHTESRIVATCRAIGKAGLSKFDFINVSKMTNDEASAMVMMRIPDLSSADATDIAEVLGCYPLAISHACGLIVGAHVSIKDLCRELSRKPHDITEENKELGTLHEILARLVATLRNEISLALELLTLIVVSWGHQAPEAVLRTYAWMNVGCVDELTYARAVNILRQHSLIDIKSSTLDLWIAPGATMVSIHPLTSTILLDLLNNYIPVVTETASQAALFHWRAIDWRSVGSGFFDLLIESRSHGVAACAAWNALKASEGDTERSARCETWIEEWRREFEDEIKRWK